MHEPALGRAPLGIGRLLLAAAFVYFILLGGTAIGEGSVGLRLVNALIGACLVLIFIIRPPSQIDALDKTTLGATTLFAIAGVFSLFPRQSLDAVTAALAYCAALSVSRELLDSDRARRTFIFLTRSIATVLILSTASQWLPPMLAWWEGTGWQVLPLFNFEHSGAPWGHRHDLTLLVVMSYPAWLHGRRSPLVRTAASLLGALLLLLLIADGSRALWLAIAVASLVVLLTRGVGSGWLAIRHNARGLVLVGSVLVVALVVSGVAGALVNRALDSATLEYRGPMWGAILTDWMSHPIAGNGPGSFPFVLQRTDYFDTNSWAPRHPDSSLFQGIAEGGLLLVAAMALLVVCLRPGRSAAAQWSTVAFAVAGLLASPSDFGFLIASAIGWVAFNHPRERAARISGSLSPVRRLAVGLGAVSLAGFAVLAAGGLSYEQARASLSQGEGANAERALSVAISLDPGMALYHRQRGALRYVTDDYAGAISDFEAALRINEWDDLAWRSLALARQAAGDTAGATAAIGQAVRVQRSDPTNLLLLATLKEDGSAQLAEVVAAWPPIVFSNEWDAVSPSTERTAEVVDAAARRLSEGRSIPELVSDQSLWLAGITGQQSLISASSLPWSSDLRAALLESLTCGDVTGVLTAVAAADWRQPLYWHLKMRASAMQGSFDAEAARMAALIGAPISMEVSRSAFNPLNENGRFSADAWGYRRGSIVWLSADADLPSPQSGYARWVLDPQC